MGIQMNREMMNRKDMKGSQIDIALLVTYTTLLVLFHSVLVCPFL